MEFSSLHSLGLPIHKIVSSMKHTGFVLPLQSGCLFFSYLTALLIADLEEDLTYFIFEKVFSHRYCQMLALTHRRAFNTLIVQKAFIKLLDSPLVCLSAHDYSADESRLRERQAEASRLNSHTDCKTQTFPLPGVKRETVAGSAV